MGIKGEKVAAEEDGDAAEHLRINAEAFEDAVAGHAARAELSAQPRHATPLPQQFLAYLAPYVDVVRHQVSTAPPVLFVSLFGRLQKNGVKSFVGSLILSNRLW